MKKIINVIILLINFIGNSQCLAPSNLTLTIPNASSAQLSWQENGTVNTWETTVVPDFYVGAALPSTGFIATTNNPFIFTDLPTLSGCNVFFVRSICSATNVSPWVAIGSLGCSSNIYNYLATLSNDSFLLNYNSGLQLFPNPSNNLIQIKLNSKIDKITLFDSQGKVILIQTQNNNEINIENLSKGVYIIDVCTENENFYRKFIKE
jgi:Secretion system C-terminal sorting domain